MNRLLHWIHIWKLKSLGQGLQSLYKRKNLSINGHAGDRGWEGFALLLNFEHFLLFFETDFYQTWQEASHWEAASDLYKSWSYLPLRPQKGPKGGK